MLTVLFSRNIGISPGPLILFNRLRKFEMYHKELREILHFQFEVCLNYFKMSCYSQSFCLNDNTEVK